MCKVNLHKNVINDKGGCMANRFNDVKFNTFSLWTDMVVVCPKCGKAGIVHFDKDHNVAIFQCEACYTKKEIIPCGNYAFEVTAQCTSTGIYNI